jgi:hypothetical protein
MPATQEEQQAIIALVAAKSLEAARAVVRQYPILMHPGPIGILDLTMERYKQAGNMAAYNQLNTTRQWLIQIQSGR